MRTTFGRMRLPIALMGALLLAITLLAAFMVQLLRTQHAALEDAVRESQAQAMSALALSVEREILATVRPPLLAFKNLPSSTPTLTDLRRVQQGTPELEQVLFLDHRMEPKGSLPAASPAQRESNRWLARRAAVENHEKSINTQHFHLFTEEFNGKSGLFVLQRTNDLDPSADWLLLRFDFAGVERRLAPLMRELSESQHGQVWLKREDEPWDDDAVNWPVGLLLPGWLLAFKPDAEAREARLQQGSTQLLVEMVGLILTMVMAGYAVWREVRRERAVIELRNRFVASVSHELKTPLALIRMYAESLHLQRVPSPERQREYHHTLLREAERLSRMIDEVLDFNRLQRGELLYSLHPGDLGATLGEVLDRYDFRIREAGLTLERQFEPGLPPVAHDRSGITQILLNLVDNAAKYGASGGKIRVSLRRQGNMVVLGVRDYGPGVPETARARVREAFQRGSDTLGIRGAGLGLALVEQIALAHRARFSLEPPAEGPGIEAVVTFPIAEPTHAATDHPAR